MKHSKAYTLKSWGKVFKIVKTNSDSCIQRFNYPRTEARGIKPGTIPSSYFKF